MGKYLFLFYASILLVACSTQDEAYYRRNPQALQQAVKTCPDKNPPNVSCEQLAIIAESVNKLAYQLQMNPQAFGKKILELQEILAKQQIELEKNPNQAELRSLIQDNKQLLTERLAIVRWLESPES